MKPKLTLAQKILIAEGSYRRALKSERRAAKKLAEAKIIHSAMKETRIKLYHQWQELVSQQKMLN